MTDTDTDYRFTHTGSLSLEEQLNLTGLHNLRRAGAVNDGQPDLSKVIIAGKDRRGYRFFGVCTDGLLRIVAGCHQFTLREARCHWREDRRGPPDHIAEIRALLDVIEAEARVRGWRIQVVTQGRGYFDSRGRHHS